MLAKTKLTTDDQKGYTIVELLTVITLMSVLMVGFMTVFINFLIVITRTNYSTQLTSDSQSLLRTMVEEMRYGAGVRQVNTITDPNANAPAGGWNTGNTNFVIITAVPALDSNREYITDPNTGSAYLNEYVYYKSGQKLYKRTLANPNATGNTSTTSCSPSLPQPGCRPDRLLVDNLDTISFNLYDQDDQSINVSQAQNARSIAISLRLSKTTFGKPVTFDNSIRITLRNQF